jgi:AcrR family transcriptional regulator
MAPRNSARRTQAERSAATYRKIIRAAREAFLGEGYNATTMVRIADRAGVAVQTVYFVFHTKGNLLNKVYEVAVLGDRHPTPPEKTEWAQAAMSTSDGREALTAFVAGAAGILRRTAPLEAVVRTAAPTVPAVATTHRHGEELRVAGYRNFVTSLAERGLLPADGDEDEVTDVLLSLLGPHMYATLTGDRGWSHAHYVEWATRALPRLLLPEVSDTSGQTRATTGNDDGIVPSS